MRQIISNRVLKNIGNLCRKMTTTDKNDSKLIPAMSVKRKGGEETTDEEAALPVSKKFMPSANSDYYFEKGLRKVYPYDFEYHANCKGRWFGRRIGDIIKQEFRAIPENKSKERFESGFVKVNGVVVDADYIIKNGDVLTSRVHRHENSVLACPIKILHDLDDLLVIDKPPSIPVHPCGQYRLNSVLEILKRDYKYENLHVSHRLDRLTSGLLLLPKNAARASLLAESIREHNTVKEYLCKVEGKFPDEEVTCEEPLLRFEHKIGLFAVSKDGKESCTIFKKLYSDENTSIVHCTLITGRTHQIRVHLQYLGYPILNDPLYNSFAFGPKKGKLCDYGGKSKEELIEAIYADHPLKRWIEEDVESKRDETDDSDILKQNWKELELYTSDDVDWNYHMKKYQFDIDKVTKEDFCEDCKLTYKNRKPESLFIYLHAFQYKSSGWQFKTALPYWAKCCEGLI